MKKIFFLIAFWGCFLTSFSQTQYSVQQTLGCWDSAGIYIPVTKVVLYSAGNITERLMGFFHTTQGYKTTATAANVSVGNNKCSLDSLNFKDFEIVQICCREIDEYIRIYSRSLSGTITVIGDYDYEMNPVTACNPAVTRYTPCFRFAPAGISATYALDHEWYSEYVPFTPSTTPVPFTLTIPSGTRDMIIYNVTDAIILLEWDGNAVGNGFYIPANSVLEIANPLTSILNTGAGFGDMTFDCQGDVGTGTPHVIVNFRAY